MCRSLVAGSLGDSPGAIWQKPQSEVLQKVQILTYWLVLIRDDLHLSDRIISRTWADKGIGTLTSWAVSKAFIRSLIGIRS